MARYGAENDQMCFLCFYVFCVFFKEKSEFFLVCFNLKMCFCVLIMNNHSTFNPLNLGSYQ